MFHYRQQLINWLIKNVKDRVLFNALESGTVELLGGFERLPGSSASGWIVRLMTTYNTEYLIAITATDPIRWYRIQEVDWSTWSGNKSKHPLYQGDDPEKYYANSKSSSN